MVIDTDGSAFITKAEFDSLKNNFQAQIDNYNSSIDSKIDGAIASYLAGIKMSSQVSDQILFGDGNTIFSKISQDNWNDWDTLDGFVGFLDNTYYGSTFSGSSGVPSNLYWLSWEIDPVAFTSWLVTYGSELRIVRNLKLTVGNCLGYVGSYSKTPDVDTDNDDWTWNLYFVGSSVSSSIDWTNLEDTMSYVLNDRSTSYGRPYGYCVDYTGTGKTSGTPNDRGPRIGFGHGSDWGLSSYSPGEYATIIKPMGNFPAVSRANLASVTGIYNVSYDGIVDYVLSDYGTNARKTAYAQCLSKDDITASGNGYSHSYIWEYNAANGGVNPPILTCKFGMPHNKLGNNIVAATRSRSTSTVFYKNSNNLTNFAYTQSRYLIMAPKYRGTLGTNGLQQTSANSAIYEKTGLNKNLNCYDSIPIYYTNEDATNLKFKVKYCDTGVVKHPAEEMHFYISKEPIKLIDGVPNDTSNLYDDIKLNGVDSDKSNLKITLNTTNEAEFTILNVPKNQFVYLNWHNTGKTYGNSIQITPTLEYAKTD